MIPAIIIIITMKILITIIIIIIIIITIIITDIPSTCVCGEPFTIDHAMICMRGGFVIQRHNEQIGRASCRERV